jgi:methionine-rich copper-binding protein CopC
MDETKELSMRNTLIVAPILAAGLAISALVVGQAAAHARLLMGTPKAGTTVAAPKALTLRYSEGIVLAASSVKVAGPKAAVATGPLALDKTKRVVTVPLTGPLAAGAYRVSWHMKTEDRHETDGDFGFTVK